MKANHEHHTETHPLFPSGEWEGFYVYGQGQEQHRMEIVLNFQNNTIEGSGNDDVGAFSWTGKYDKVDFRCRLVKHYATHQVQYDGRVDENGIWGTWLIYFLKGGFHIWPKNHQVKEEDEEERVEVVKKATTKVGQF